MQWKLIANLDGDMPALVGRGTRAECIKLAAQIDGACWLYGGRNVLDFAGTKNAAAGEPLTRIMETRDLDLLCRCVEPAMTLLKHLRDACAETQYPDGTIASPGTIQIQILPGWWVHVVVVTTERQASALML